MGATMVVETWLPSSPSSPPPLLPPSHLKRPTTKRLTTTLTKIDTLWWSLLVLCTVMLIAVHWGSMLVDHEQKHGRRGIGYERTTMTTGCHRSNIYGSNEENAQNPTPPFQTQAQPLPKEDLAPKQSQSDERPAKVVGFYNMYIPTVSTVDTGTSNCTGLCARQATSAAERIIQEQLRQVANSYLMTQQQLEYDGLLLYVVALGYKVDEAWLNQMCRSVVDGDAGFSHTNLTCVLLEHHVMGSELITLTRLHEYCGQNPNESVVYLHDKGSFNPNPTQDRWRQAMTAAVTSQSCYEAMTEKQSLQAEDLSIPFGDAIGLSQSTNTSNDSMCDLCGTLFSPLPGMHFEGNIFSARCSYINRLLTPTEFVNRQVPIDAWVELERSHHGNFRDVPRRQRGGLFAMTEAMTGRNRYSAEHWVASHPSLRPCDVSWSSRHLEYWTHHDRNLTTELEHPLERERMLASSYNYTHNYTYHRYVYNRYVFQPSKRRKNDYFLLRGAIFRWLIYYGRIPSADSYVWDWFPDGMYWKKRLLAYFAKTGTLYAADAGVTDFNASPPVTNSMTKATHVPAVSTPLSPTPSPHRPILSFNVIVDAVAGL